MTLTTLRRSIKPLLSLFTQVTFSTRKAKVSHHVFIFDVILEPHISLWPGVLVPVPLEASVAISVWVRNVVLTVVVVVAAASALIWVLVLSHCTVEPASSWRVRVFN